MNGEDEGGAVAMLESAGEDDGYVSPEFDLPPESDEEMPPPGRQSFVERPPSKKRKVDNDEDLDDEEELALRLLRQRR